MVNKQSSHWLNFIGGEWLDSDACIAVSDPSTDQVFATIASADLSDVEQAMAAARQCVRERRLTRERPAQRAKMLYRIGAEIRKLVDEGALVASQENGKSINIARDEFTEAACY
ncbi:MAG: aldehyde dehydrogenase family protein, partial [Natronospirillum sp.]